MSSCAQESKTEASQSRVTDKGKERERYRERKGVSERVKEIEREEEEKRERSLRNEENINGKNEKETKKTTARETACDCIHGLYCGKGRRRSAPPIT